MLRFDEVYFKGCPLSSLLQKQVQQRAILQPSSSMSSTFSNHHLLQDGRLHIVGPLGVPSVNKGGRELLKLL